MDEILKNVMKTNSVKFYGGWGDVSSKVNPLTMKKAIAEIRKMLHKKNKPVRESIYKKIKSHYYSIADTLLLEQDAYDSRSDRYLKRWQKDLGLLS